MLKTLSLSVPLLFLLNLTVLGQSLEIDPVNGTTKTSVQVNGSFAKIRSVSGNYTLSANDAILEVKNELGVLVDIFLTSADVRKSKFVAQVVSLSVRAIKTLTT